MRRKSCPPKCPCICHDTGGGWHMHPGRPCPGKSVEWIDPPPMPPWLVTYLNERRRREDLPVPNASALRREAAALLAEADRIENRPDDLYVEGTVITFTKPGSYRHGDGSIYTGPLTYAALKAGDRTRCWFLTGVEKYGKSWDELLNFIGDDNLYTAGVVGPAVFKRQPLTL